VAFVLSTAPAAENNTFAYIDGVYQEKAGYSVAGSTLTFSEAPPLDANIEVITLVTTVLAEVALFEFGVSTATSADGARMQFVETFADLATLLPSQIALNGYVTVTSTGFIYQRVVAGHLDYSGGVGVQLDVMPNTDSSYSVDAFGAVGDGVTDDIAALTTAKVVADANVTFLVFGSKSYKVSTTYTMPSRVRGNIMIVGNITWKEVKAVVQEGRVSVVGTVLISGVWYSNFTSIDCAGFDLTIDSSQASWGTYWNNFGTLRCAKLILDCDTGGGLNQNTFEQVRCSGVHIKGVNVTGTRNCHGNVFDSVDTTGANLTGVSGLTGAHLLNDSNLNEPNTVRQWYSETTGQGFAKGNWNILGTQNNFANTLYLTDRRNSALFSQSQGRAHSVLATSYVSPARGGDWSQLNGLGYPVGLVVSSGMTSNVISVTDAPDGNPLAFETSSGGTFKSWQLRYELSKMPFVSFAAYVKRLNPTTDLVNAADPRETIYYQDAGGGTTTQNAAASMTPMGDDWYLMRGANTHGRTIDNAAGTQGIIFKYQSFGSANTDKWVIGSFAVSTENICPLPQYRPGQKTGYSASVPSAGIWAVGDICWSTTPAGGGTPGWVCVTAGSPGTWKAMAVLAV
jgi:hypothetical protein